jgi:hypothetical protein
MAAKVAQQQPVRQLRFHQRAGGSRQQHLAAVGGSGDARRTMHVDPHVAGAAQAPLPGVQAHPHSYRTAWRPALLSESTLSGNRGPHRGAGCAKDGEEGVTLGAHLYARVFRYRRSHDRGVPFQHGRVVGAQALEQARRALDVSEQKGDGAAWQVLRHGRHDATPGPGRSTLLAPCPPGCAAALDWQALALLSTPYRVS